MSDVENTTAPAVQPVAEPISQQPDAAAAPAELSNTEVPAATSKPGETSADDKIETAAAVGDKKDEPTALPEKVVEPITEGLLHYKGPGLLKSILASKKDFWLTDESCTIHELSSYLRGEKPDVAHPVAAWATQTGKGLLFFNKKGDTNRKQPGSLLALYDATDLRKRNPQEISFSIAGNEHVLKASTDFERDGWFVSIEKSTELAKASKEEILASAGYKEELEKLNKPHLSATAAAVASKRGQSQPKKSAEADRPTSEAEEDSKKDEPKKEKKARSTSRGVLNRFKGKKDEAAEPKKEKEADKENVQPAEDNKTEEAAAVGAGAVAVTAVGAVAVEEEKKDSSESAADASKTEEKPKPNKRGSIFGKIGGWGAMKSPTKEKDAELKPEVPAKDEVAAEEPPVLPETATTERTDAEAEADKIESKAEKEVEEEHAAEEAKKEEAKKEEVATPAKEKTGFLSGLLPKRNRSVSPSVNMTKSEPEAAKETTEITALPNATETSATETAAATESAEKTEEPAKTETPTANKRQSMLGSLSRRASKAMSGMRAPKKENATPAAGEATKEEEPTAEEEKPVFNDEAEQPAIGDVVPSAVIVNQNEQPPAVAASA